MLSQNVWLEGLSNSSLMKVLQDELQWVELQQYIKDPHFASLLDAIQNMVQFDDRLKDLAKSLLIKFYDLCQYISQKLKLLIDVCILEMHSMQERALEIEKELQKQRDRGQDLQEGKQIQQKRLEQWEQEYETMKAEYVDVIAELEQEKKRAKQEWKEAKQYFLQVREENEYFRFMLQNLAIEKMTITEKMQSEKKKNEMLLEEIQLLKQKLSDTDRQLQSSAKKVSYGQKRLQKLQDQLAEKEKLITVFTRQEMTKRVQLENYQFGQEAVERNKKNIFGPKHRKQESVAITINLAEDIFNQEQYSEQHLQRPNLTAYSFKSRMKSPTSHEEETINFSVSQKQSQPPIPGVYKLAPPDFYFVHYLLTVQSIKLKLGQQDLFPIDMSGYYSEMIKQGTPFHEWDEWIKDKLQQLFLKKS